MYVYRVVEIGGAWGRTIQRDLPAPFNLRVGDRLEPSSSVMDVAELERSSLPIEATFWRANLGHNEQLLDPLVHRCPIFNDSTGITIDMITIDVLHTVMFGPCMRFVAAVLWRILLLNVWGHTGREEQVLDMGCKHIRGDLFKWQKESNIPANVSPHLCASGTPIACHPCSNARYANTVDLDTQ